MRYEEIDSIDNFFCEPLWLITSATIVLVVVGIVKKQTKSLPGLRLHSMKVCRYEI